MPGAILAELHRRRAASSTRKASPKGWNISKSAFRAMVDSALGLDPQDESPAAKQKRVIQG